MRWALFTLFIIKVFGSDFDFAFIGSSPILLFEALYKHHRGEKIAIFEAAERCGGAWKSIDICGIQNVDMGCHEIGSTPSLNSFLERYAGCSMISHHEKYYFSKGCSELIENLLKRVRAADIPLFMSCRVNSVALNVEKQEAALETEMGRFTASKLVVTNGTSLTIDGVGATEKNMQKFYHLYLLIEDPTPQRFFYHSGTSSGLSRVVNLTHCAGMELSGLQMIVLQTHSSEHLEKANLFFEDLKKARLIDSGANLLKVESYIYEQGPYFRMNQLTPSQQAFFELLNTSHFNVINTYAAKWSQVLPPYKEGLP
jgi:hypothetical protein